MAATLEKLNKLLTFFTYSLVDLRHCFFYFDLFILICTYFVLRTRGIVYVLYLLFCYVNYKEPCKLCRSSPILGVRFPVACIPSK